MDSLTRPAPSTPLVRWFVLAAASLTLVACSDDTESGGEDPIIVRSDTATDSDRDAGTPPTDGADGPEDGGQPDDADSCPADNRCDSPGTRRCDSATILECTEDDRGCLTWESVSTCGEGQTCAEGSCRTSCTDQCSDTEASRCAGDTVERCGQYDDDSCLEWGTSTTCGEGETCSEGSCESTCTDRCSAGETRCLNDQVETCGQHDGDTCREWGDASSCGVGQTCSDGACVDECPDECATEGAKRCSGDAIQTCEDHDADACREWGGDDLCPPGETCADGSCEAVCNNQCAIVGDTRCSGGEVQTCDSHDQDGCLEWGGGTACGSGETCSNGSCVPDCSDQCASSGATRCSNDQVQTCSDHDGDTCLEWDAGTGCGSGETCSNGSCVPACSDQCSSSGATRCSGDDVQTCGDHDGDTCLEWDAGTACGSNEVCDNGSCEPSCADQCGSTGETRCHNGEVQECGDYDSDVCLEWSAGTACGRTEQCSSGSCTSVCSDQCSTVGASQCDGDTVETCDDHDSDPCYEWGGGMSCGPDQTCTNGACQTTCTDECSSTGDTQCDGAGQQTCDDHDGDSCLEWSSTTYCGAAERCQSGSCQSVSTPSDQFVISEVVYDTSGADDDTFVEIHGPTNTSLAGYELVGVNGNGGGDYDSVTLEGSTDGDGLFVIAHDDAGSTLTSKADQVDSAADFQNGPDNLQLRWGSSVIDAVGYGDFSSATFAGEGRPHPDVSPGESLARWESTVDTDDNKSDFHAKASPTPDQINPDSQPCQDGDGTCPPSCNSTNDSDCSPVCGNQVVESGEECDDGNTDAGDGCSASCQLEHGPTRWATHYGGPGDTDDYPDDIAVDSANNVYVVGTVYDKINFGSATYSTGEDPWVAAAYIAKYDAQGTYLWSKIFSDGKYDYDHHATTVAVDSNDDVHVAGTFRGEITFGSTSYTTGGDRDMFLASFDSSGTHQWSDTEDRAEPRDMTIDDTDDIYVTGDTREAFLGGQSPGGSTDLFVVKYDNSGGTQWSVTPQSSIQDEFGRGIAVDSSDNVYVTGSHGAEFYLYDGSGNQLYVPHSESNPDYLTPDDMFVVKFDSTGTAQWANTAGDLSHDRGKDIAVDPTGGVLMTGNYQGGSGWMGGHRISSSGTGKDIVVASFDASGNADWIDNFGGTDVDDGGLGVDVDGSGRVYLSGYFQGSADFGGGTISSNGNGDAFVAAFDNSGTYRWAERHGSNGAESARDLVHAGSRRLYVSGTFTDPVDFGTGTLDPTVDDEKAFLLSLYP